MLKIKTYQQKYINNYIKETLNKEVKKWLLNYSVILKKYHIIT